MSLLSRSTFGIFLNSNCKYSITTSIYLNSYVLKQSYCLVPRVFQSTSENNAAHFEKYTAEKNESLRSQYIQFDQMVDNRRKEARRSIIVQVNSEKSCAELHAYCSLFGYVKGIYHYSLPEPLHFALVEFQNEKDVKHIMEVCRHMNTSQVIPAISPLLWFRAKDSSSQPSSKLSTREESSDIKLPLVTHNGNTPPSKAALRKMLLSAETFSDQIAILHDATQLKDIGVRLRFLTARQLELTLSGIFPRANALPFGSSVNGFGKHGCDLDVAFNFDEEDVKDDNDIRLVFHAKTSLAKNRTEVQRHMELIGGLCEQFLPGCSRVKRILQARVPIIKFKQELMDVECDLSMTNRCAVYMSELLYMFGSMDYRVRPLIFVIRCWAREVGLTNPSPGQWITNFSLTLLVLFYLQSVKVLPSLQTLMSLARPEDKRITSDGVNCTFLRDIVSLQGLLSTAPSDSLEALLFQFFNFYASFDFGSQAISLVKGVRVLKPDHSPLYIENPLETSLNVTKNMSVAETERFKIELGNATWNFDINADTEMSTTEDWGLVSLFDSCKSKTSNRNVFYTPKPRKLVLQTLYENESKSKEAKSVSNKSKSDKKMLIPIDIQAKLETKQSVRQRRYNNTGKRKG